VSSWFFELFFFSKAFSPFLFLSLTSRFLLRFLVPFFWNSQKIPKYSVSFGIDPMTRNGRFWLGIHHAENFLVKQVQELQWGRKNSDPTYVELVTAGQQSWSLKI